MNADDVKAILKLLDPKHLTDLENAVGDDIKAIPGLLDSKRFTDLENAVADLCRRVEVLEGRTGKACVWCEGSGERLYSDGMMHPCKRCRGSGKEPE